MKLTKDLLTIVSNGLGVQCDPLVPLIPSSHPVHYG